MTDIPYVYGVVSFAYVSRSKFFLITKMQSLQAINNVNIIKNNLITYTYKSRIANIN